MAAAGGAAAGLGVVGGAETGFAGETAGALEGATDFVVGATLKTWTHVLTLVWMIE